MEFLSAARDEERDSGEYYNYHAAIIKLPFFIGYTDRQLRFITFFLRVIIIQWARS